MGVFEDTVFSWLQIEREARSLAEASSQQAPPLATEAAILATITN
ncbi:hypothetical protein [Levilactobacillus yonginensis]